MAKLALTDPKLKSLKPAPAGGRYELLDSQIPGLGVRVTDKGQRTFILKTRYPGSQNPTRRALGEYPSMSLAEARERASEWRRLIGRGIDPATVAERERQAACRTQANVFAVVAEDFIREKVLGPKCYDEWKALDWKTPPEEHKPRQRKGLEVARDIRRDLSPAWGRRPITDIPRPEIRALIEAKALHAPAQARNLLGTVKRIFSWAVDKEAYGLTASPADTIKPSKIDAIGEKKSRERALDDVELFALWRAAKRLPYPAGPVYQLLILNALRLNEVADATSPEFDYRKKVWIIPGERMKGKRSNARPHAVPLIGDSLTILAALPKFKRGDFLFSTTFGKSPVWITDKVKKRVDERMLRTLRALARQRGEDPKKVKLKHWVNHDIRRTVRSNLSALRVQEEIREAVLAHVRPGIKRTYDVYDYLDEKREALELWAARLRSIVEKAPGESIELLSVRA
jgi:integrase